jgi:hypothetical protein
MTPTIILNAGRLLIPELDCAAPYHIAEATSMEITQKKALHKY